MDRQLVVRWPGVHRLLVESRFSPAVTLLPGAVPLTGIALTPVGGILIGGAMTATSQAGRHALDDLAGRHGEYEAALSQGLRSATPLCP
jgi:putative ABC transport system permease protein